MIKGKAVSKSVKKKKAKRTFAQIFLDKLIEASDDGKKSITNESLQAKLGWSDDRYEQIWEQLKASKQITISKGRSGMVGLPLPTKNSALKMFVSYSSADEDLKNELLNHLSPLQRRGLIKEWHFRKLVAGQDWDGQIHKNLEDSDIFLILVSSNFLASKYCYDVELEKALQLKKQKNKEVVPIILRNCLWKTTVLADLQALPTAGRAVRSWPDCDEAFVNIAEGIKTLAESMVSNRP